jgi:hypothetical protein
MTNCSGNIFADLGFEDAAVCDMKVRLAVEVMRVIDARKLTTAAAAVSAIASRPELSPLGV